MRHIIWILVLLLILGSGFWLWAKKTDYFQQESYSAEQENPSSGSVKPQNEAGREKSALSDISLVPLSLDISGKTEQLKIADGFKIVAAAEGLGKARFMSKSPDGRIFVPDMVNYNLSREGRILILRDWDEDKLRFRKQTEYLTGLRGPNDIAFYKDKNGSYWIYIALTKNLLRYPYEAGDAKPSGEPEIVAEFPNQQTPGETSVVWHITRTISFHNGKLYVSVGSGCNSCEQPEDELRALILEMDPNGQNSRVFAKGLRNAVGLEWAKLPEKSSDYLFATVNGVDHLGPASPDDTMYRIDDGEEYGWPYCYESEGRIFADNSQNWQRKDILCSETPASFSSFSPHSAPLGLEYFEDFSPELNSSFLVALHGSHDTSLGNGYKLTRVSPDGRQQVFMDGFQRKDGSRFARPVDILQKDDNSFYFTDDLGGRIFYVYAD